MASHNGLVYVLKTKNGYINEKGEEVSDIKLALQINFERFGFVTSASRVYEKLGFSNQSIKKDEIRFYTVIPSYERRLDNIEKLYIKMDNDYNEANAKARHDFIAHNLHDSEQYTKYLNQLQEQVIKFYKKRPIDETVIINDKNLTLHKIYENKCEKFYIEDESKLELFCSDIGEVHKYSIDLKNPHVEKYFDLFEEEKNELNNWQNNGLIEHLEKMIMQNKYKCYLDESFKILDIKLENNKLQIYFNSSTRNLVDLINSEIRNYYNKKQMHITRMFGSYILLKSVDGKLKAVKATPIPIKYCPLMVKLLKEVGGKNAETLLETLKTENEKLQSEMMCNLINEVVIAGGYFDTNRPLNSCEANVLFGASETMSSAFKSKMIDAAVIVSNNLGTIITTNDSNTQGAVKRMTGLFYTSPSEELIDTAKKANIIPVFPHTANIDQLQGVKKAIKLGYKKIAVSVAASDNYLHKELKKLEKNGVKIYKFGLCSTGIEKNTTQIMKENADVIWSCASKQVKEYVEPNSIAQVGIKIPVHVMTSAGWDIVENHLRYMDSDFDSKNIVLSNGEEKPVLYNNSGNIKKMIKKDIKHCADCPHPCI